MTKILSQGHFDGFCLLYAFVNGFKALKYPQESANRFIEHQSHVWQKLIAITPSLHNFASGEGSSFGVSTDRTDVVAKERFMDLCTAVIGERKNEEFTTRRQERGGIATAVGSGSVVLMCLGTEVATTRCTISDHWACVVDADAESYYLACSYTEYLAKQTAGAEDGRSPNYGRPFNNRLCRDKIRRATIVDNSVYCLRMA